ncbi:MAG: pentapeptide repeat-containing protein [Acidimicrobiales bacterium]
MTIVSSTLSGGSVEVNRGRTGTIFVQSSILDVSRCGAGIVSLGHNLLSGSGCSYNESGDISGPVYPVSGPLADNGGEVLTLLPDPYGDAVDGGLPTGCTLTGDDARGFHGRSGPPATSVPSNCSTAPTVRRRARNADLRFCDFEAAFFAGIDLSGAGATGANFEGADLSDATLVGSTFSRAKVDNAVLNGADLTDADLSSAIGGFFADGVNFTRARLENVAVRSAVGADFTDADAPGFGTWAFTASIAGANIEGADFTGGSFWGVTSGGLTGTATFSPGVGVIDGYLIDTFVSLDGVDFSDADTTGIGFGRVTITNSDLSNIRISSSWAANYTGSTLDGTDWTDTYADNSVLRETTIVDADMTGAVVASTSWRDALVVGVDFTDASLWSADFRDAILLLNTWDNTTCPSGVNSDDNGGNCDGQFTRGAPSVGGGAPVPAQFQGMGVEDFAAGGLVDE